MNILSIKARLARAYQALGLANRLAQIAHKRRVMQNINRLRALNKRASFGPQGQPIDTFYRVKVAPKGGLWADNEYA